MRNTALEGLDMLVGDWSRILSGAWFLESREVRQHFDLILERTAG